MFKFRGKTKDGKWVEGDLLNWKSKGYCAITPQEGDQWENPSDFVVIPESLAISTGLTDKNGVEIFSSFPVNGVMSKGGDVIKYSEYSVHNPNEYFGIIIYHNGKFVFYNSNEYIDVEFIREHCIILGNQFDNEETK